MISPTFSNWLALAKELPPNLTTFFIHILLRRWSHPVSLIKEHSNKKQPASIQNSRYGTQNSTPQNPINFIILLHACKVPSIKF
jgi:hypothetical protein